MLELNLLNSRVNKDLDKFHKVDKFTFYKKYLTIINNGYWANNEIEFLAFMMSQGVNFDITAKGSTKKVSDKLGYSLSQVSNYKRQLITKGWLVEPGDLIDPLKSIIKATDKHKQIKLTVPMDLT